LALRRQGCAKLAQRGFAAVASEKASYEPTTIAGVKVAARDDHGPTTRLAVVAKAGTRYEIAPGLTVALEEFAFKARQFGSDAPLKPRSAELICLVDTEHDETIGTAHHPRI
jgi:hypothetical protein